MKAIGQWNTAWDPFFELDPVWTDEFMATGAGIYASGVLPAKEVELLSIAFDASYTHMYAPGTRRHIQNALEAGATVEEIMEVLSSASCRACRPATWACRSWRKSLPTGRGRPETETSPAMSREEREGHTHPSAKERALEEFKAYWIITLYLALFLGALTVYRRLILAEFGVAYLNYGFALIEALIIGKIILIGKAFGLGRRFEDGPLVVSTLYKSALFGVFVFLFGVLEHVVEGLYHKKGLIGGLREIAATGADEIGARALMLTVAFVPFFAFTEIGRTLGKERLWAMFFSHREPRTEE